MIQDHADYWSFCNQIFEIYWVNRVKYKCVTNSIKVLKEYIFTFKQAKLGMRGTILMVKKKKIVSYLVFFFKKQIVRLPARHLKIKLIYFFVFVLFCRN